MRKGDEIIAPDGTLARIRCVIKTDVVGGKTWMSDIGGIKVTPFHPIRIPQDLKDSVWKYPHEVAKPVITPCDAVYNFVLSRQHVITVHPLPKDDDPVQHITLGHGFRTPKILKHPFFGTRAVIKHLATHQGWTNGLIHIKHFKPTFDPKKRVKSFF